MDNLKNNYFNPYIPSVTFHCHWKADRYVIYGNQKINFKIVFLFP